MRQGPFRLRSVLVGAVCAALQALACGRVGVHVLPRPAAAPADAGAARLDAGAAQDAAAQQRPDAAVADAAARDAGVDAGQADAGTSGSVPRVRVMVDNALGPALTNYPVRLTLDTAAAIAAGWLRPDCAGLSVSLRDSCAVALPYFLPGYACGSANSELWVLVPAIAANASVELQVVWDGLTGARSDGTVVFPFFDGFDGPKLDSARWQVIGSGTVTVSDGVLSTLGIVMLQSASAPVVAGSSTLGVRMAAQSRSGTDVELGVGSVSQPSGWNWAYERVWDGATFLSYDRTTPAYDGPAGSPCDRILKGNPAAVGPAWVDVAPAPASFLLAELSYARVGADIQAWLRTSRGAALTFTTAASCGLPLQLPILIGLDHAADADSEPQRIDYVYVRPSIANEPLVTIAGEAPSCPGR